MKKIWNFYNEKLSNEESSNISHAAQIYDRPDSIMNQYASRVYEDTEKIFNGFVTESYGGDSSEVSYALYISSTKLKDYSYRLIEVIIPNIFQPYPLDVTLYAKDPKNHRTFSCSSPDEFRRKLLELIESPVTKIILKHLKTLIEISEQNSINYFSFSLTDKNPTKTFLIPFELSPITINKIILQSHLGEKPDNWSQIIANSFLKIHSMNKVTNHSLENTISLLQFLSVYHAQPVLELKLVLPFYEFYSRNKSFECELKVTLLSKDEGIIFTFYYEAEKELVCMSYKEK
jgi:hypothetical protein